MTEPVAQRNITVRGVGLTDETRCTHYHGPLDIIAIRMKCCGEYYACRACHDALAGHPADLWPATERGHRAVLCGSCSTELTIDQYLSSGDQCPQCGASFNPGCRTHHHLYFAPG